MTRQAVLIYAEGQKWTVGEALVEHYNLTNPSANGVSFETVVAGAIASYDGSVADFVQRAAELAGDSAPALPAWTKSAKFGAVTFEDIDPIVGREYASLGDNAISKIEELMKSNQSGLIRPPIPMRPDIFGPMDLGSDSEFSVAVSAKLLTRAIAGDDIADDLTSTIPKYFFQAKPSTKAKATFKGDNVALVEQWGKTWQALNSRTNGRVLRIHVALRKGYSKKLEDEAVNKLREYGELDEGSRTLPAVRVKGNEVRVIIDASNYAALFVDPKLQEGIAKLLAKTQLEQKRAALRP